MSNSTLKKLLLQLLDKCLSFVEDWLPVANFCTASTAVTESIVFGEIDGSIIFGFSKFWLLVVLIGPGVV